MTNYTIFHHIKHKRGLVFVENDHFDVFVEEISAIVQKFPQPWVAWVVVFACLVPVGNVHLHVQRMHDMRSPSQAEVTMGLAQAGFPVEVGVLPIGEPPVGGS